MNKSKNPNTNFLKSISRMGLAAISMLLLTLITVAPAIAATPTITVVATDNLATEAGLTTGILTFTRVGDTTTSLTVSYTVSGTATSGSDYSSIGTSVIIPAGATTITKTVTPLQDTLQELNETIIVTLKTNAKYIIGIPSAAAITLTSDDPITQTVTVAATDNLATEAGLTTGTFTFTRTGIVSAALTVSYTVGGTATSGSDYAAIGTSVNFPAGVLTVTKTVTPLQDILQELDEAVVVTVKQSPNYAVGTVGSATVTLTSDEPVTQTVTVAATDNSAAETGLTTGTYTFTRTGSTGASLTVNYTVGGTATSGSDYVALGTSVIFPAGVTTITKTVTSFQDNLQEPNETVILTLQQSPNYAAGATSSATVTIMNLTLPSVSVHVDATDTNGFPLTYVWRTTDGSINNINNPTTTWILPAGPGIHFAYVLVSNGKGGYTERRVAVITDSFGVTTAVPAPASYAPPPAPVPTGNSIRANVIWGTGADAPLHSAFVPDVLVSTTDTLTGITYPPSGTLLKTDIRGQYVVTGLPPSPTDTSENYIENCSVDGGVTWEWCEQQSMTDLALSRYVSIDLTATPPIMGRFRLADSSICGTVNEFFGKEVTATASLHSASGFPLAGPVRLSVDGDFSLPQIPKAAFIRVNCEGANPVTISLAGLVPNINGAIDLGLTTLPGINAPIVANMTASLNGVATGLFLPPPSGFPSDKVPDAERFLTYQGIDTRRSACQYYKAIGAVKSCDAQGNFSGAINVEDWKRQVKIGAYATPGTPEYSATYINQVDLNLTRNHHSISYGPDNTAAYVCNHLGPPSLNSTQVEINTAIGNAVAGKNLVACVMMDYTVTPGVNGDQPFTRFLIFGPSGELLPSVNLDGRREKFVPGVCVGCHGGYKYVGHYPEDGSGGADIGAHFLPYDVGNFAFSDKVGLTQAAEEEAIYNLNQNVLKAGPTPAAQELITGWYPGGIKTQNLSYLPPTWVGKGNDTAYHKIFAHSCRTCHVNLAERFNFDNYANTQASKLATTVCAGGLGTADNQIRMYSMPNSLVTFNRFWNTKGTADDLTALYTNFMTNFQSSVVPCSLH